MSDAHHDKSAVSPLAVIAGVAVCTLAGMTAGVVLGFGFMAAPAGWESSAAIFLWRLFAGTTIGGVSGLAVGVCMAWHASVLGATSQRADLAPAWGILTGLVFGASLGPVFGGALGYLIGPVFSGVLSLGFGSSVSPLAIGLSDLHDVNYLAEGVVFGLLFYPIAAIVSWEASFWLADLIRARREESYAPGA